MPTRKTEKKQATTPARKYFVPSPEFSPPYTPLPHYFNDWHVINILCQAPKGALKRALPWPLEPNGDKDLFIIGTTWSPDCEGFNVHEIAILIPVKWKGKVGATPVIEYIDSDMGLIAGREIWGWPKKMADIVWTQTATGWTVTCHKQKDQGSLPLMKVEFTISSSTPEVEWPEMFPTYVVKRIPNASHKVPPLTQLICLNWPFPPDNATDSAPAAGATVTKGTATAQFFDGPYDPLTFFGPVKVLDAMTIITKGPMVDPIDLGEVVDQWEE